MSIKSGLQVRPIVLTLVSLAIVLAFQICGANAKDSPAKIKGESVFKQYCASCHQFGGNVTIPSKTVAGSSKLSTLGVFKDYLNNPVGHMPYFKNVIEDQKTLQALYSYCKTLSKKDIKQVSHEPGYSNKI